MQDKEFPEYDQLLEQYANGIYAMKQAKYQRQKDRKSTAIQGLLFTIVIGICDVAVKAM